MELQEALDLFEISDISSETEVTIKKKYKKLMIKYHPDNRNGDESKAKDIVTASELLKDVMNKLSTLRALNKVTPNVTIIIPINKLIDIYSGEFITMGNSKEKHIIGKKEIQKFTTYIISNVAITHDNVTKNYSNVQLWTIGDSYSIDCNIYVNDITQEESVKIALEDFEKEIRFKSQSIVMKVPLKYNVSVAVRITKKIITDEPSFKW